MLRYGAAQSLVDRWQVPVLLHANHPHERLYIANFDGTGNDAINDPEHITNIGLFNKQLYNISRSNRHIYADYEVGPGTQTDLLSWVLDRAGGYTYDEHLESMYFRFINQANRWLHDK